MSPEKQRIAIAEVCGFRKIHEVFSDWDCKVRWASAYRYFRPPDCDYGNKLHPNQHWGWVKPEAWAGSTPDWEGVPDYLNDLNAMYKVEQTLNRGQRATFRDHLGNMFKRDEDGDTTGWEGRFGRAIHATAVQRAEAFIRVLKKWEKDEDAY